MRQGGPARDHGRSGQGDSQDILSGAECVIIIPSMKKGGFVFGANYGRGVATCRLANDSGRDGNVRFEGGSWGLQIGGQAVDLVMLVMNKNGTENLLKSKFKIGADASAAAGPVGRQAEEYTDWRLRAELLTYSRARGLFAGVTLNGAVLKQDADDTVAVYGKDVAFRDILTGKVAPPPEIKPFIAEIAKDFHAATTQQAQGSGGKQESGSGSAPGSGTQ